jgi:signal transduction histidine kinase
VACGTLSSVVWSVLSGLMIAAFFAMEQSGVPAAQDFSPTALAWLRLIGYLGIVFSLIAILYVIERARLASMLAVHRAEQALERERIASDMHDGAGNQLLGLMTQVRAGKVERSHLLHELEQCFADLRQTLDSLDAEGRPISYALAESRTRITRRCEASGIELAWHDALEPSAAISARASSHIARFLHESTGNALRHAHTARLDVTLEQTPDARISVCVRDFGIGFDPQLARGLGRGLDSLYKRAQALDGALDIQRCEPGVSVELSFPMRS